MGKLSRRKGARGELEIVNLLKDAGIPAKRISMMETNGVDKGDVAFGTGQLAQVKRGQHIPKFIYDALGQYDALFMRRDNEQWLVTLPLQYFIVLAADCYERLKRVEEDIEVIDIVNGRAKEVKS